MDKIKVCFLVNNPPNGIMDRRARYIVQNLDSSINAIVVPLKGNIFREFLRHLKVLFSFKPRLIYIIDGGFAPVFSSILYKISNKTDIFIDYGDLSYLLSKRIGKYNFLELGFIWLLDKISLKIARIIFVRGYYHKKILNRQGYSNVIQFPDGVVSSFFKPLNAKMLRKKCGLERYLVYGALGNNLSWCDWIDNKGRLRKIVYGLEIIESLRLLKNKKVKGLIVGDGNAVDFLKKKAKQYGVDKDVVFTGRVPHNEVPLYLSAMDVCLLTQPDDLIFQVRNTSKLPEYLALEKFIIATKVGDAQRVIKDNGFILEYKDEKQHAKDLADKINYILKYKKILENGKKGREIALKTYEYRVLGKRLSLIFKKIVSS